MIEAAIIELAAFAHKLPDEVGCLPVKDIIRQYRPVLRRNYNEMVSQITAVELGTARALVAGLGGKSPGKLPGFDEAGDRKRNTKRIPAWMKQFEKVNGDRAIQTG